LTKQTIQIGILRSTSIGDVVLTTALVDFLEKLKIILSELEFKIYFITKKPSFTLIDGCLSNTVVLNLDHYTNHKDLISALSSLDFLVDAQVNIRSYLICRNFTNWTGKPTFQAPKMRWHRIIQVFSAWLRGRRKLLKRSDIQSYKRQFQWALEPLIQGLLEQGINKNILEFTRREAHPQLTTSSIDLHKYPELREFTWLAIAPGASYASKRYPIPLFIRLLNSLNQTLSLNQALIGGKEIGLLFLGDASDQKVVSSILEKLHWDGPTLDFTGKTTLSETAAILKRCVLTICNDSSVGHISEAVGTPSAVIFGPTSEEFGFAPFRAESKSFSSDLGCRPCSKHGSKTCRFGDQACFQQIDQNAIINWTLQRIGRISSMNFMDRKPGETSNAE